MGILKPKLIDEKGIRNYSIEQISNLKLIKILRTYGVSIEEIKTYLKDANYSYLRLYNHFEERIQKEMSLMKADADDIQSHFSNFKADLQKFDLITLQSFEFFTTELFTKLEDIPELLDSLEKYFKGNISNLTYVIKLEDFNILNVNQFRIKIGVEKIANISPKKQYAQIFQSELIETHKAYSKTKFQNKTNETQDILRLAKLASTNNLKGKLLFKLHNRSKIHKKYILNQFILL